MACWYSGLVLVYPQGSLKDARAALGSYTYLFCVIPSLLAWCCQCVPPSPSSYAGGHLIACKEAMDPAGFARAVGKSLWAGVFRTHHLLPWHVPRRLCACRQTWHCDQGGKTLLAGRVGLTLSRVPSASPAGTAMLVSVLCLGPSKTSD